MRKVFVTGGAGFIGSHVVDELLGRGYFVVVLDDLSTGKLANLPQTHPSLRLIRGSVLDSAAVDDAMRGCDVVIHLAAIASVQASVDDPEATHRVNFDGTLMLLEAARKANVKRFLFASSAAVYGNAAIGPIAEDVPLAPQTPYAIDKLASEHYIAYYQRSFGMAYTTFRFFNVYGPRQCPLSPYSGVISIFAASATTGRSLTIYGDGLQTRDFVYVHDVCRVLVDAIDNDKTYGRTINLGTGQSTSLLDVIDNLGTILGRQIPFECQKARPGDIKESLSNVELLNALFGWLPSTCFLDGLRATIQGASRRG